MNPEELVAELTQRAHDPTALPPPRLLEHSADPPTPLEPVQELPPIADLHGHWADVHALRAPQPTVAGVAAKVRARVATVAGGAARGDQRDDRALIGDLIQAVDALATRSDELARRLDQLQSVVDELIGAVGEELVQLRATVAPAAGGLHRTTEVPEGAAGPPPGGDA